MISVRENAKGLLLSGSLVLVCVRRFSELRDKSAADLEVEGPAGLLVDDSLLARGCEGRFSKLRDKSTDFEVLDLELTVSSGGSLQGCDGRLSELRDKSTDLEVQDLEVQDLEVPATTGSLARGSLLGCGGRLSELRDKSADLEVEEEPTRLLPDRRDKRFGSPATNVCMLSPRGTLSAEVWTRAATCVLWVVVVVAVVSVGGVS